MKVIESVFLAESVTTRSNNLVMITNPKSEADRKKMSPFAKLGRIPGQTIRGWVRHAMEKLLIHHGVSVCHPLSSMSITADRNKEYYKSDLALGYHSRGECKDEGGCIIYQLFGDLNQAGNLITPSVYFFPTTTGNGTVTKNVNRLFGCVGTGRLEVIRNSPRARYSTDRVYLTVENLAGVMIEAPLKLVLRIPNKDQEILLLKALEFLKVMAQNSEFDFLIGGMRTSGYGKAAALTLKPKKARTRKRRSKNQTLTSTENEEKSDSEEIKTNGTAIQFQLSKVEEEKLELEFQVVVTKLKEKFPLKPEEKREE